MKLALLSATLATASAFTQPQAAVSRNSASLSMSEEPAATSEAAEPVVEEAPVVAINGWVADESAALYGLPGAVAPLGFFDPLGFSKNKELTGAKRLREAEIIHGRVAMAAVVGKLVGRDKPVAKQHISKILTQLPFYFQDT